MHLTDFLPFFTRKTTFVTYCLFFVYQIPSEILNGIDPFLEEKRNNFDISSKRCAWLVYIITMVYKKFLYLLQTV